MQNHAECPRAGARPFWRDENGGPTVETVLWLAFLFGTLVLVVNASFLLYGRHEAFRTAETANRLFATGALTSAAATETAVADALSVLSPGAQVSTAVDSRGVITTVVQMPFADLAATGAFGLLTAGTTTISAQHFVDH